MQNVASKKQSMQASCRSQRELRKQAAAQGIPKFMLRLAAAQQIGFLPTNTMPRHRHD